MCALCAVFSHDSHSRLTVQSALDHLKAEINTDLAKVRDFSNKRFLRGHLLQETRLLIQLLADKSFADVKARYDQLWQKLDDDYQKLKEQLQSSVDQEFAVINAAVMREEAQHASGNRVMSYVRNVLATTDGLSCIERLIDIAIPAVEQYLSDERQPEQHVTSHAYQFTLQGTSSRLPNKFGL